MAREPVKQREQDHPCDICGEGACYGLGPPAVPSYAETWRCGKHVLPGFLPKDRSLR